MTFPARAKSIIDAMIDGTATPAQLQRVTLAFARKFPHNFTPADPLNPTNADYARCFVLSVRQFGRQTLRSVAITQALADADAQTAGDAAAGDL